MMLSNNRQMQQSPMGHQCVAEKLRITLRVLPIAVSIFVSSNLLFPNELRAMERHDADVVDSGINQQGKGSGIASDKTRKMAAGENQWKNWKPPVIPKPAPFSSTNDITPEKAKELAEKWGVRILGIRMATAGFMMDFRFHVMDVEKALPLFDYRIPPYVKTARTNMKFPVPKGVKVGGLRPTNRGKNIRAGKNYDIMFGNPDRHVKVGEKVSVIIGDFMAENLTVN